MLVMCLWFKTFENFFHRRTKSTNMHSACINLRLRKLNGPLLYLHMIAHDKYTTRARTNIISHIRPVWCGIRAKNEKIFAMVNFVFTYHAELTMAIFFLMVLFFK